MYSVGANIKNVIKKEFAVTDVNEVFRITSISSLVTHTTYDTSNDYFSGVILTEYDGVVDYVQTNTSTEIATNYYLDKHCFYAHFLTYNGTLTYTSHYNVKFSGFLTQRLFAYLKMRQATSNGDWNAKAIIEYEILKLNELDKFDQLKFLGEPLYATR